MIKRILKIISIVVLSLVMIFGLYHGIGALVYLIGSNEFLDNAVKEVQIPGRHTSFVPQGLSYVAEDDTYVFCGYKTDKTNSCIYLVKNNEEKRIDLSLENNKKYTGHAGGISVNKNHVYISNASKIFYVSYDKLVGAKDKDTVEIKVALKTETKASFCFSDESYLYVGEYYDGNSSSYSTKESHHYQVPQKQGQITNHALVAAYPLDDTLEYGVSDKPSFYISIGDTVQGMAISKEGHIILSTSSGLNFSRLKVYKTIVQLDNEMKSSTFIEAEEKTRVYLLGNDELIKEYKLPPMSEDLAYYNGRVYVNFESGSSKYSLVVPSPKKKNVYSIAID